VDEPIRVLVPILHVLEKGYTVGKILLDSNIPCENYGVVLGYIAVSASMFVDVSTGMVVIGHKRERPSRQNVLASRWISYDSFFSFSAIKRHLIDS
jgi:hypothetical protein